MFISGLQNSHQPQRHIAAQSNTAPHDGQRSGAIARNQQLMSFVCRRKVRVDADTVACMQPACPSLSATPAHKSIGVDTPAWLFNTCMRNAQLPSLQAVVARKSTLAQRRPSKLPAAAAGSLHTPYACVS
jgi:hypothetical protein